MKAFQVFIVLLFSCLGIHAQEPADALRYSWFVPGATARVKAIGGSMGSLGGDISATFVNPAGLAFYRTGDFVLTPTFIFNKNKSAYLGTQQNAKNNKLSLGTSGFVFGNSQTASGKSSAFSIAINHTADFNNNIVYAGRNNQSSYSQKFLEEIRNNKETSAHNIAIGTGNYRFGTALALQTGWIDTAAGGRPGNQQFRTNAPVATGLLQQNTVTSTGGINELALGYAVAVQKNLMLGGSLNIPFLDYTRNTEFLEADATNNNNNKFNYAQFTDKLTTTGAGVNLKLGLIYKPTDYWRMGLAFHSPTFYVLKDNYTSTITTDSENFLGLQTSSSDDADFLASYGTYEFKYGLTTPYRAIGSVSYVLREIEDVTKQKGFLTADIEYVNYKSASFHPGGSNSNDQATVNYLNDLNSAIKNAYKGAFNFRAGGELKFTTLMVRAGFAYYGNPYNSIHGESGSKMNISGGLGYRNKGLFVDLTYVESLGKDVSSPYRLQYAAFPSAAIKSATGNIYLTFGVKI